MDWPPQATNTTTIRSSSGGGIALDTIIVSPASLQVLDCSEESTGPGDTNGISSFNETSIDSSRSGIIASSDFYVHFPLLEKILQKKSGKNINEDDYIVLLEINDIMIDPTFLCMSLPPNTSKIEINGSSKTSSKIMSNKCVFKQGNSSKPSTDMLQKLLTDEILQPGRNSIQYILAKISSSASDEQLLNKTCQLHDEKVSAENSIEYDRIDTVEAYVYLWNVNDFVIVVDIDGTITKSNVRGVISSMVTEDYEHVHDGVCAFFSNLCKQTEIHSKQKDVVGGNVRLVYLSSRPMKFMNQTRKFLTQLSQPSDDDIQTKTLSQLSDNYLQTKKSKTVQSCFCGDFVLDDEDEDEYNNIFCAKFYGNFEDEERNQKDNSTTDEEEMNIEMILESEKAGLKQNTIVQLPEGPIFLHPEALSKVLVSELIKKNMHEYKSETLIRQIVTPFIAAGKYRKQIDVECGSHQHFLDASNIFVAGFGNTKRDAMAYSLAGIAKEHIFIINKKSEVANGEIRLKAADSLGKSIEDNVENKSDALEVPEQNYPIAITMKQTFDGYADPDLTLALNSRISEMTA